MRSMALPTTIRALRADDCLQALTARLPAAYASLSLTEILFMTNFKTKGLIDIVVINAFPWLYSIRG